MLYAMRQTRHQRRAFYQPLSIDNCVTANAGVDNIKEWDILGIRCCGKKLYLEVRIKYNFSTPSSDSYQEYGNKYEVKNIMLSMNKKDGSNLVYEADLSKAMMEKTKIQIMMALITGPTTPEV